MAVARMPAEPMTAPSAPVPAEAIDDFASFGVRAFTTTREAGSFSTAGREPVGEVTDRWSTLRRQLSSGGPRFATAAQVHGSRVVVHSTGWEGWLRVDAADGHLSVERGTGMAVTIADCVPVFIAHPSGATALLPSGWRGTAGRIVAKSGAGLNTEVRMSACNVFWLGADNFSSITLLGICALYENRFAYLASGTPPTTMIQPYNGSIVVGNAFSEATAIAALTAVFVDGAAGGGTENGIVEAGNQYAAKYNNVGGSTGRLLHFSQSLRTRDYTVATGAAVTIVGDFGFVNVVTSGGAGAVTLDFDTLFAVQPAVIYLVVRNPTGNNHTMTTSGTSPVDVAVAINAGLVLRAIYNKRTVGGTASWFRMTGFTVSAI